MPEMPFEEGLISVVMSTYNRSSVFLRKSIESILCQTYADFEFIIIDDGSNNGTKEIIKSYNDPRIRLIVNEKNIGLTSSLNRGLDECRGEFIARMDDDDIAYPRRFEKQISFMRENPDVIVCGTWVECIDENGQLTGQKIQDRIENMDTYRIYLLFGNIPTIPHPSAMMNRRMILKYNLRYEPEYSLSEDYRLWLRCANSGKCAILPEILMKYRRHGGSVSLTKKRAQESVDFAIMQLQFDALHLTLTDDIKSLHFHLLTRNKSLEDKCKISLKNWIKAIIKANDRYKIYNQKILKSILWNRWRIICQTALKQRPGFKKSLFMLMSLIPMGLLYGMKSAIKKLIRRLRNKQIRKGH